MKKKNHLKEKEKDELDSLETQIDNDRASSIQSRHRTLLKSEKEFLKDSSLAERGRVVAVSSRTWIVQPEQGGETVECIVAGAVNARNSDQSLVAVGDFVRFLKDATQVEQRILGMITEVEERKTKLARKPAGKKVVQEQVLVSNVDQLVILMSAADPFYNKRLIDRYLIVAEKGDLEPIICINKTDLMDEDFIREDLAAYDVLGIPIILISALKSKGFDPLKKVLKDRTTVFSGPSGAGKSTVTNALLGNEFQATGGISRQTSKGTHTTTNAQMFPLPGGGYIVDTPGIRELAAWQLDADELPYYFTEFNEYMHDCKFAPCTHTHEPGCAVKEAVEIGEIDAERYQSYLQILDSLE